VLGAAFSTTSNKTNIFQHYFDPITNPIEDEIQIGRKGVCLEFHSTVILKIGEGIFHGQTPRSIKPLIDPFFDPVNKYFL